MSTEQATKDPILSDSDDDLSEDDGLTVIERLEQASTAKDSGNRAFKEKDHDTAITYYSEALSTIKKVKKSALLPEQEETYETLNLSLHLNSSMVNIRLENWQKSVSHADEALAIKQGNVKALYRRGYSYIQMGEYQQGKVDLLQVLKIDPKNRDALKELSALKKKIQSHKEQEKMAFSEAFKKVSVGGGMYGDIERKKKAAAAKKRADEFKRKQRWAAENKALEEKGEQALTFEEWDEKDKAAVKEAERVESERREELAKARDEYRRKQTAKEAAADVELDDEDLAAIAETKKKGYCYFRRNLPDHEKELIGSIAPEKLTSSESVVDGDAPRPIESKSSLSAWNSSGTTWEEKNITDWAKAQLKTLVDDLGEYTTYGGGVQVKAQGTTNVDGDAQVVVSSGKVRRIFDMTVDVKWTAKSSSGEKASGKLKYVDVSSTSSVEEYESQLEFTKAPETIAFRSQLGSAMQEFEEKIRDRLGGFVAEVQKQGK